MNRRGFLLGGATLLSTLPFGGPMGDRAGGRADAWAEELAENPATDPARVLKIAFPDKSPPSSWQNNDQRMQGLLVDVMAEVAESTGYLFRALPRPLPRVQLEVVIERVDWHLLISKASPALKDMAQFDQAIKALKTSSRYAELLRRYGMEV